MSTQRSLWYGYTDPVTIHRNGTNSFIRIRGTFNNSSKTITSVVDEPGFFNINYIIPGQKLVASTYFPSGTTITAVDTGANTIEVLDFPAATGAGGLARISPAETQYFIESGSLVGPTNNAIQNYQGVTGSEDTEYNTGDRKWGVFGIQAPSSNNTLTITGEFSLYEITRIYNRRESNTIADFYMSSSVGILQQKPDLTLASSADRLATVQLSETSSLPPIFDVTTIDNMPGGGVGFSGYPIAIPDIIDQVNTGSGAGSGFPFTGSAQITGSLSVTGSSTFELNQGQTTDFFLIKSSSFSSLKVNSDGVVTFGNFNILPTAVDGGMAYSGSNFYVGIE